MTWPTTGDGFLTTDEFEQAKTKTGFASHTCLNSQLTANKTQDIA